MAPLLAGIVADATNLKTAILWICISTWVLCFVIYLGALFFIPKDIQALRAEMKRRADVERAKPAAG